MLHNVAVVFAIHMLLKLFFGCLLNIMVFKESSKSFCMKGICVTDHTIHVKNRCVFCHLANIQLLLYLIDRRLSFSRKYLLDYYFVSLFRPLSKYITSLL